ncbi:DNA adenine methylase [Colwellia sp. MSW7]|uniref:site-specific DNA-methyltransferase (adenine-specific) n=1 Tax=Colwellia maritima TaxID=2912588 RepID=A0ABS9X089_9GAMM|nr:DNA adenine methylase [Colwellia maritima]MCI2283668.1 DNA adenine methylase [Colwellia maritima]
MYPGGKGKTYQHLINLMPPHKKYIEPFLGSGIVIKNKLAAKINIGNDINKSCIDNIDDIQNVTLRNMDSIQLLESESLCKDTLIYCDPPYVASTRRKTKIYRHEYSDNQDEKLLQFLTQQKCMVMISGYESDLYKHYLNDWNLYSFSSQTQNGKATECVWFNFEKPTKLHDSRYLGNCFRERQTIKRRQVRLQQKIKGMNPLERSAFMEWLNTEFPIQGEQL